MVTKARISHPQPTNKVEGVVIYRKDRRGSAGGQGDDSLESRAEVHRVFACPPWCQMAVEVKGAAPAGSAPRRRERTTSAGVLSADQVHR